MCCSLRGRDRVYTQTWVEFVLHNRWPGPVAQGVREIVAEVPGVDLALLTQTVNAWVRAHGPDFGEPDYWNDYKSWAIARLSESGPAYGSLDTDGQLAQGRGIAALVLDR